MRQETAGGDKLLKKTRQGQQRQYKTTTGTKDKPLQGKTRKGYT